MPTSDVTTMATRAPAVVREFLADPSFKELEELYENSLKALLVCGLEFYLSASLVASFFQCPDETVQAEQELQTLYTLAWVPIFLALVLVYGPKISTSFFPSPDHFERNMLRCKILTWMYAFGLLIWDPDMILKTGPSMGVSILFCITDVGRFIMDMKYLTDVEYDENGNSFVIQDKTEEEPQEQVQEENYTVQLIGAAGGQAPWQKKQTDQAQSPVHAEPSQPHLSDQSALQQQGPSGPHRGGHRRLGQEDLSLDKRIHEMRLDKSPSLLNSEYVAVVDPNVDKETKKSFTYEF